MRARRFPPPTAMDSSTVFAGRPGAIRAVDSVTRACGRPLVPWAVAVSTDGLVVDEEHDVCPPGPNARGRLVLRSFGGRLVRVLAPAPGRCTGCISSLRAAGHWAAYVAQPNGGSHFDPTVQDVRTGRVRVQLRRAFAGDMAIDASGDYATLVPGPRQPCQPRPGPDFAQLDAGRVGHRGLTVLARRVDWSATGATPGTAIAGNHVAFVVPTGRCLTRRKLVTASEGAAPRAVAGLRPDVSSYIAFDGHLLAVAQGNTIELTATDCGGPSVPVPAHEPAYHPGPTELVSGIYNVGGHPILPPCKPEPHGPVPGKITVTDQHGQVVATQHARSGHLARIPLAPGTYTVRGRIAPGALNETPSREFAVRPGETVRQDAFEPVP